MLRSLLSNPCEQDCQIMRIGALLLSVCCFPGFADVQLQEKFEHYTIAPAEVDQIKLELRRNSPVSRKNQVFHGETEWTLIPNFRWQWVAGKCRVKDVLVQLNGTYTLPKLLKDLPHTSKTRQRFDSYYQALLAHEKGHQDLWLKAGEEIEHLLLNFPPYTSCSEMNDAVKSRIAVIIGRYQQLNRDYDKQTGHGRTQGASIY